MKTWNIASKKPFKFDEYSHWPDWLSFWIIEQKIIDKFFTNRIFDLDTDNSNFWMIRFIDEHLSIHKYKWPTWYCYAFSCTINTSPQTLFEITNFSKHHSDFSNWQWWVIHFYWTYFRAIELWQLSDDFILEINKTFSSSPVVRMDYRFDFLSTTHVYDLPSPLEVLPNLRKNKKWKRYLKWEKLQSWEVWNKMNKTVFIRLYNKLEELEWNLKKTYLYSDIDKFKSFFRLEYEFGFKWCAWYVWSDIPKLFEKAFWTSWLEPTNFKWNMYKPQVALDLSDKIDKLRYIKMFRSMAWNLQKNWIDPILLLQEKIWI